MEQLESRSLLTTLVELPVNFEPAVVTDAGAESPSKQTEIHSQRADAREANLGRRSSTVQVNAVITSDSSSLNGALTLSITRRLRTTGTFATTGVYGFFQVTGWLADGPIATFHAGGTRRLQVPVQGYTHLETLVQLTLDKSNGTIQGTVQPTLYGRRLPPLVAAQATFTGAVISSQ